jgi:hypothetical protein
MNVKETTISTGLKCEPMINVTTSCAKSIYGSTTGVLNRIVIEMMKEYTVSPTMFLYIVYL